MGRKSRRDGENRNRWIEVGRVKEIKGGREQAKEIGDDNRRRKRRTRW